MLHKCDNCGNIVVGETIGRILVGEPCQETRDCRESIDAERDRLADAERWLVKGYEDEKRARKLAKNRRREANLAVRKGLCS